MRSDSRARIARHAPAVVVRTPPCRVGTKTVGTKTRPGTETEPERGRNPFTKFCIQNFFYLIGKGFIRAFGTRAARWHADCFNPGMLTAPSILEQPRVIAVPADGQRFSPVRRAAEIEGWTVFPLDQPHPRRVLREIARHRADWAVVELAPPTEARFELLGLLRSHWRRVGVVAVDTGEHADTEDRARAAGVDHYTPTAAADGVIGVVEQLANLQNPTPTDREPRLAVTLEPLSLHARAGPAP